MNDNISASAEYFRPEESIAKEYGGDTEKILEVMGERFMKENPPRAYQLRTFRSDGIPMDRKGRVLFEFDRLLPDAEEGDWGMACGELWCALPKSSGFCLECTGRTLIYLNGVCIFDETQAVPEKKAPVRLEKGFNRFLVLCLKTSEGFGCTLRNHMPQWEPCAYVTPFQEWRGEAGFLYTLVAAGEFERRGAGKIMQEPALWGKYAEATKRSWYPKSPSVREGAGSGERGICIWTRAVSKEGREEELLQFLARQRDQGSGIRCITVDGETDFANVRPACAHHILWFAEGGAQREVSLPEKWSMTLPVDAQGDGGRFLLLEGLTKEAEEGFRSWKPNEREFLEAAVRITGGKQFWQTEYRNMTVRPYVESSLYGRWTYPLGVTLYGLMSAGDYLKNAHMSEYVRDFIHLVIKAAPYAAYDRERYGFPGIHQQMLWLDALDDCGSFGSCMLEEYLSLTKEEKAGWQEVPEIADRIGTYMMKEQVRCPDGAFKRRDDTMWVDDMYMSVPFLVRYYRMTLRREILDEACRQLLLYRKYFELPVEEKENAIILSHMYDLRQPQANRIPWSRGNGWVFFSLSELLMVLPGEHPQRGELVDFFSALCRGYLHFQDERGLWHQILDDKDTYMETSGSAMFICAMARGIRFDLFSCEEKHEIANAVRRGWNGMIHYGIDREGNLYGVCQGSGWSYDRDYYRNLKWNLNDTHGIGIVMLAGTEAARLNRE